jgi:hypothetical protein
MLKGGDVSESQIKKIENGFHKIARQFASIQLF